MLKAAIIGASGYTGAELAGLIHGHPHLTLAGLYVSNGSQDAHKPFTSLHPRWRGIIDLPLLPLDDEAISRIHTEADLVLLATAHEVSHDLAPGFLAKGLPVFDLSGAFRVPGEGFYDQFYGFHHQYGDWLAKAAYGLAEWNQEAIKAAQLIAVPGCYPTASLSALKPLQQAGLVAEGARPIISAVSGVSGAGRKASMNNSFCEVSLKPYGVFNHRHQPEISHHLGKQVVFQPHLGNFIRGILATVYVQLKDGVSDQQIAAAYHQAYDGQKIVRLAGQWPQINDVAGTPFCDLHWGRDGNQLIVVSAIDNLLKGAASQAIQCINIHQGFSPVAGLIKE
ncbi:N-acetyl-gamma-glutamyl-phosphate reductase [Zobellella denitrificans]|jgi:N-acetyl-gamma-glutamyl-phosphate reductase|uniref:N-acetyl-gamma-glutamyl-phosphate reductase n=1 Tax=Zobellella denitrificans TaxID=347534 RepID=UPI000B8BB415|nr:N-acetyl-gamma-glutamyl-phosphate reductase [Zobellella denitrificans]OXS15640.1 N-acetyl-gamma-glutamyl-phosphate reductase [Zobellella denitrificans]